MEAGTRDWVRLGRLMRLERKRLGKTQAQVGVEAGGLSARTVLNYERGREPIDTDDVPAGYYRIEPVIGWAPGSVDEVLAGRDPVPVQRPPGVDGHLIAEVMASFSQAVVFGRLCVAAGGDRALQVEYDAVTTRLLASVPAAAALSQRGLQGAELALAALRAHDEGAPTPLDDVLRAYAAVEDADSEQE